MRAPEVCGQLWLCTALCAWPAWASAQEAAPALTEESELKAPVREDEKERARQRALFESSGEELEAQIETESQAGTGLGAQQEELQGMTREELEGAGFFYGEAARDQEQSTAVLSLLTVGLVVHGAGHWALGEERTAAALLTMEAAGLLLWGAGVIAPRLVEGDWASAAYSRHAVYAGVGLFGASFLLDVAGLLQADGTEAPANTTRERGLSVLAQAGYLDTKKFPVQTVLRLDMSADLGAVGVYGSTLQDVALGLSMYGAGSTWRFVQDGRSFTYAYVRAEGEYMTFRLDGAFDRLSVLGTVGGSLDMGLLTRRLRGVACGAEVGYMSQWYWLQTAQVDPETQEHVRELGLRLDALPLEVFVHGNMSERMHLRVLYRRRDGDLLQDGARLWGIPGVGLTYSSAKNLDLVLRGEYGGGLGIWGGLRAWVF
jgi:hypothetical protein